MTTITMTDLEICLDKNIDLQIPTCIWGPPGVGKSELVEQVARKRKIGLIDFRATLCESVDLRGLPMVDTAAGTSRWLPPEELPNEKTHGKKGILFLDELPQADPSVQKGCFSLVLDRYIGKYHLPDGWAIVAAGNRMGDRSGASRMLKALANRFAHYEVTANLDSWMHWAVQDNVEPIVAAFMRFRPNLLHAMPAGDENAFPTPRAWEKVSKVVANIKQENIRQHMITALVGEGAAVEMEAFIRTYSKVPSIDLILKDPMAAHVPDLSEPAMLYAVANALSRRVTQKTMANAFRYIARMPKEYRVAFAVDASRRDSSLKETKAFGHWLIDNKDVLI